MSLLIEKHIKNFRLCLHSLPARAQGEDANKLAIVYFVLHGLGLLDQIHVSPDTKLHIDYIYSHLINTKDTNIQAFRSSQTFKLQDEHNDYDLPNLSATLFALASLLILKDDYSQRLDRHKIMAFVARCQVKSGPLKGSFVPVLDVNGEPWGESDLRLCYIAASIRKMVGYDRLPESERVSDIDVNTMTHFILDKFNFNGGLASTSFTESHSGLTFCGLAALKLTGFDLDTKNDFVALTQNWLVHRQVDYPVELYGEEPDYEYYEERDIGGFNGRENKFADTCYSWWVMSLLEMLGEGGLKLIDGERALTYLLEGTQHKLMGGFGKDTESMPDPFHSFLGLASVSLLKASGLEFDGMETLQEIDTELVITKKLREFMDAMWQ